MKRAFAFLMALIMVFSLGISASAAGTNGSITITNATIGETYNLFKFFDAAYAVDEYNQTILDSNGDPIVSYTITPDNQFFEAMFGANGETVNDYFEYNTKTGVVTKRSGVADNDLYAYLDLLASTATADRSILADSDTVVFDNIGTGYYLIDRGISSVVTITTNTPNVQVIDKNQIPNADDSFSKLVYDEEKGTWEKSSSANVGDIIEWSISFVATNYDGDQPVLYYSIRDTKTSSLWVEFDDITITVENINGTPETINLTKGYYYCADDTIDTDEWDYQGSGWDDIPEEDRNPNDAQWYLIHYGYDDFEIVIPWMDDYTFEGVQDTNKGYELTFDLSTDDENEILSESMYDSPSNVVLKYTAAVGPDAANTTSQNSAMLDWVTPRGTFGPEDPETTDIKVYNLGLTKTANDGSNSNPATRLAGAVFELYRDEDCTQPIWVIETNNEGVYILDDVDTVISGTSRTSSREMYAGQWEDYIKADPNPEIESEDEDELFAANRRNDMVTPANGQLIVMGLEAGTYYLKETQAPQGYNQLDRPVSVEVGTGATAVYSGNYKDLEDNAVSYTVYSTFVQNNRGFEMPSTGGKGTLMMITFGTLTAIGFAILLITQKKMSIYQD